MRDDLGRGPPRFWERLLQRLLGGGPAARSILGDLREEHATRAATLGFVRASWWYRREAASIALRALTGRLAPDRAHRRDTRYHRARGSGQRRGDAMGRQWLRDLHLAARALLRAPGFAVVTTLTLGVAIAANASIFSVVNAVLLRPLPFPEADRLVEFRSLAPGLDLTDDFGVSPEFEPLYRRAAAVEDLGLFTQFGGTLRLADEPPEAVMLTQASISLFSTLGVRPIVGRLPTDEELAAADGGGGPVLISYRLWQDRFGGDPNVTSRTLDLSGTVRPILGVMGPDFQVPNDRVVGWVPFRVDPARLQQGQFSWRLVGRIREGVSLQDVTEQLVPLIDDLKEQVAASPRYVQFLERGGFRPLVRSLKEQEVGSLGQPLWILLGTVLFVLLIACANAANLFLVRAETRQRDMAVRAALGASRARIVRAYLSEAILLAGLGGALGLVLAWAGTPLLLHTAPEGIPRLDQVDIDPVVLAFAGAATLGAALLVGLLPAIRYSAPALLSQLRFAGRGAAAGRERHLARNGLVVLQASLAMVLLVGSGLLLRSFQALQAADPGFDTRGILTFQYALPRDRYPTALANAAFHTRLIESLRGLPGVRAVGATDDLPLGGSGNGTAWEIEGTPSAAGELGPIIFQARVSPGYFEAIGLEVRTGRDFVPSDHESPWGAAIVSESMARARWPGQDPLGKRLRTAGDTTGWDVVVGVVEDARTQGLREEPPEMIYRPLVARDPDNSWIIGTPTIAVRADRPEALIPAVRARVAELDPSLPVFRIRTMEEIVSDSIVRLSFTMLALAVAAAMALLLGAVGLYGVLSYLVTQRTQEIGVRMALGAGRGTVRRMVVAQGGRLILIGVLVGVAGAAALGRFLQGLLFGTEPLDAVTFAFTALIMGVVGLVASYLPARRASSVDPVEAMRAD
ncbi:MAG: ABC transporter permease [Gemmatimonadetes bacterium]|nr:MAG: ABC transporter permease [Gemmatimonadota bacterium]